MVITEAEVKDFRNIEQLQITPHEGVNIIYGENAQGKTNFLESLWLLTGAKSFRNAADSQLIRFGEKAARIACRFRDSSREQSIVIKIDGQRAAESNGVALKTPGELAGKLTAAIFTPGDLNLINGGPGERRRLIDLGLCVMRPTYLDKLRRYTKTLAQRGALLKSLKDGGSRELLEDYDILLAKTGSEIIAERESYTRALAGEVARIYAEMSGEEIELSYRPGAPPDEGEYLERLRRRREEDIRYQATGTGPHRDELEIKINGRRARDYASQGQRRGAALTLRLAGAGIQKKLTGERPVILLDDVLSELDERRQDYVLNAVRGRQVFITACDPGAVRRLAGGAVWRVEGGRLTAG